MSYKTVSFFETIINTTTEEDLEQREINPNKNCCTSKVVGCFSLSFLSIYTISMIILETVDNSNNTNTTIKNISTVTGIVAIFLLLPSLATYVIMSDKNDSNK